MKQRTKRWTRILGLPVPMLALGAVAGLIGLMAFLQPTLASADTPKFYLDCPTTEVREGESVDVFLVRVTNHQHGVTFGAYWHTDAGTAGTDDYVHQDTGAIWGNDSERRANRAKRTFRTRQDSLLEGSETFTARFTPVDNVVDRDDPARDEKCEITLIDDDPNITEVEVISTPARGDTYGVGETIEISATFNTAVDVNGTPALGMWAGGWKAANYHHRSGDDTLVFGYTVRPEDRDTDGIVMDGGYQDENSRWHNFVNHTAVTGAGTDIVAYRAYRGLPIQSDHKIDGSLLPYETNTFINSTPASGDTYRHDETIYFSIAFSAPLEVEGSRHLNLRVGDVGTGLRVAGFEEGSGTTTLLFGYTVEPHDLDIDGVTMLGTSIQNGGNQGLGGNGTVKVKGTNTVVTPTFSGLQNQAGHKIDGRPYPKTISITSSPAAESDTYCLDEVIQVSVQFDQNVTAGDDAIAIIAIGSGATEVKGDAAYASGNGGDTLAFEYTVLANDSDANGINAFVPHGQDIKATGTDVAYVHNPGGATPIMGEDSNHKVDGSLVTADTTAPTIASLSITSDPGDDLTYVLGDVIEVTLTFSEDVTVTGTPQLELDFDGTVKTASYASTDGDEVVFSYTVALKTATPTASP